MISVMKLQISANASEYQANMSFSSQIKDDLVRYRTKTKDQRICELSGLTLTCGSLRISKDLSIVYTSESFPVGNRILSLSNMLYKPDSTMEIFERERRRAPLYIVRLSGDRIEELLLDIGVLSKENGTYSLMHHAPEVVMSSEVCVRAFLRGAFLGSGSCVDPHRSYHLEIVTSEETICKTLLSCIQCFSLSARYLQRKDKYIVYLKGDDVAGFLALVGANLAALKIEDVRTEKEFRNYVNRCSNCETANIGKTVDAALLQLKAIEIIEQSMKLENLPIALYEAARLRMQHPDMTLQELADLAEIGKSGMNHRLTRLLNIAEDFRN